MFDKKNQVVLRRKLKKSQKRVLKVTNTTEDNVDRYLIKRLARLIEVRRFVLGWLLLVILLVGIVVAQALSLEKFYLASGPVAGGNYREGIVGKFSNFNPLFAQSDIDASVSNLIFASLYKYDENGKLVPELAEGYTLDASETVYTIKLKPNLTWHDGHKLTAKDVVYTINSIKNPEVKSFLLPSWRAVEVKQIDELTVELRLSVALSSFNQSFTVGIIPEHILNKVPMTQLRSNIFNTQEPVGAGPFMLSEIQLEENNKKSNNALSLKANSGYVLGQPKLSRITIVSFEDENQIVSAYNNRDIDGISGLKNKPEGIKAENEVYHIPISGQVMVFFKNSQDILADKQVRQALVKLIDKEQVLRQLSFKPNTVDGPFLKNHVGYNSEFSQVVNKRAEAEAELDKIGWQIDPSTKVRKKDGKELKFVLTSVANSEYTSIASNLQKQWRDYGVQVEVNLEKERDITGIVAQHNYDALLYGISVGSDPDVYAFWHSSQGSIKSETRLNLSEYKSTVADKALEAGRTRSDPAVREVKYRPFLQAWRDDAPALALYSPEYMYIASPVLKGFSVKNMQTPVDRYSNVVNWTIKTGTVKKQ